MPNLEPLCHLIQINSSQLSKEECILVEAELFTRLCDELKEVFRVQSEGCFNLIDNKEEVVLDAKLAGLIINDILGTKEYNLNGIAYYTGTNEDVIEEIVIGLNTNPSAAFLRRLIDLHRCVRRELYTEIAKKLAVKYLAIHVKC